MLVGWIYESDRGTKIWGRAGSDLNGMLVFSLLLPVIAFGLYGAIREGQASDWSSLALVGFLFVIAPLIFWINHADRRQAEPLVRFIRDAVCDADQTGIEKVVVRQSVYMETNDGVCVTGLTAGTICETLKALGEGDFLILATGEESYLQTILEDGRYRIERRDGGYQKHFRAHRRISGPESGTDDAMLFRFEDTLAVCLAFASGSPMPDILWERMEMPPTYAA